MPDRLLAEFDSEAAAAAAIRRLHHDGCRRVEAYMPFPSHEIDAALGERRSRLPWMIFVAGVCGAGGAYFLQWLLEAYLYPLVVGSRPTHFPLAFVIITFEMGVLAAGVFAFVGTLWLGRLVRLTDEVQGTAGFESVTRDRFWVEVSMRDPAYDEQVTPRTLRELGALRVESGGDR